MEKEIFEELSKRAEKDLNVSRKEAELFFKYLHHSIFMNHLFLRQMEIEIPKILKTKHTPKGRKILERKTRVYQIDSRTKNKRMYQVNKNKK